MPEEVFIIALAGIVFGTTLVGFVLWNIFSLIRAKIEKGQGGRNDINPQFFKALSEFKKGTERRLTNLEAIVSDLEEERYRVNENEDRIQIEDKEVRSPSSTKDNDGNLRNMLNE